MPGEIIAEGEVRVGINLAEFDAELRALTGDVDRALAELSRKKAQIDVELDITPFESEADVVDKQLSVFDHTTVTPRVDLDTKLFFAKARKVSTTLDILNARELRIGADTKGLEKATAQIVALRALASKPITLDINIDENTAAALAGAGAAAKAGALGGAAGGARSRGGAGGAASAGILGALLTGGRGGGGGGMTPWGLRALGGFGIGAGIGSIGSFAGFGTEHIVLTIAGVAGSAAAAAAGGALIGAGALGSMAVGGGSDIGVLKSTVADAKSLGEAYRNLTRAQAVYGKGSEQAVTATKELRYQMKELAAGSNGEGVKAELHMAHEFEKVNEQWDRATQKARVISSRILERGAELAKHFIPKIAHAAEMNLPIINRGLAAPQHFLEGPEGSRIWATLEHTFKKNLPTALHAFDQAMQFVLKTVAVASHYTGGFVKILDKLFTKWNSPEGFKSWEGEIHKLVDTFKVWMNFFKVLGADIFDLFSQDAHTGRSIIQTITQMLEKVHEWEKSTKGKREIHNLFVVHKEEILALLRILPPLVSSFKDIYMTVAPPMVEAVTSVLEVVAKLLNAFEKSSPLARWALGLTLIAAKLKILVPLLRTVGILSAADAAAGAAGGKAGAATVGGIGLGRAYAAEGLSAVGAETASSAMLSGGTGAAFGSVIGGASAVLPPLALAGGIALLTTALMNNSNAFSEAQKKGEGYLSRLRHGTITIQQARKHLKETTDTMRGNIEGIPSGVTRKQAEQWGILPQRKTQLHDLNSFEIAARKEIKRLEAIYHNGIMTIQNSWIEGLEGVKIATIESMREINKESEKGSPEWRKHTAEAMAESIKAIKEGMHNGTITMKEGKEEIHKLLIEMLTVSGKEPQKLGEHLVELFKKKGYESVAGMIKTLSQLPPKSRGIIENTIEGMLTSWAKGHPKLEHQVRTLTKMFETTFSKSNRHVVQGAESLQEDLGKTFGKLLSGVSFDLGDIAKNTEKALHAMGVGKTINLALSSMEATGNFGGLGPNERQHGRHATGARVDRPTFFAGEEAPQHPEWVIASNPAYRDANVGYWAEAGHALGIPGFKAGGLPKPKMFTGPAMIAGVGNEAVSDAYEAAKHYIKKLTPAHIAGVGYIPGGGGAVMAQMWNVLKHYGANKIGASGYIGNAGGESGLNPAAVGTGGGGLFGFTTPPISLSDLHAFANESGKPWTDVGLQMQFMLMHGGRHLIGRMNRQNSPGAAAAFFMNEWERPGIPRQGVREAYARAAYAKGYKGGGKVTVSSEADRAVAFARAHKGDGPLWGNPPGGWCGEFMAADMKAAGVEPPHGFPLAANWASWGEPRQIADAGDVVVYGGSGHVGLAVGNGALISGDWGGVVGKSAVHGGGYPGPIKAIRRPPYKETSSSSEASGGEETTASQRQKYERGKYGAGSTVAGGTSAGYASRAQIEHAPIGHQPKSKLPSWATGLGLHEREELEGRDVSFEERRGILAASGAHAGALINREAGRLSHARAKAERHHEWGTGEEKAIRGKITEDKARQKAAANAAIKFNQGYIKHLTKRIKEINEKLKKGQIDHKRKVELIAERATLIAARQQAREEIVTGEETIGEDERWGEEMEIEEQEETETAQNYIKEAAEAAAEAAKEKAAVFSEDVASLNSARFSLLAGNASNILNLSTGGELMPGHLPNLGSGFVSAVEAAKQLGGILAHGWEHKAAQQPPTQNGAGNTVNQYLTINTPEVNPHIVAQTLAFRARVA